MPICIAGLIFGLVIVFLFLLRGNEVAQHVVFFLEIQKILFDDHHNSGRRQVWIIALLIRCNKMQRPRL